MKNIFETNLQQLIHKKTQSMEKWISTRDKGILKEYKKFVKKGNN